MITLLIGTCDSYSFLWDNFTTLCDKHWLVDCEKIFISETKKVEATGYKTHLSGNGPWTDRIISALETVETEYTFFILEDYFLTEVIDQSEIDLHIEFIKEFDANKVMMEPLSYLMKYDMGNFIDFNGRRAYRVMDKSDYLTSVQPSVWKTDFFKKVIHKDWNPWQFECTGTDMIRGGDNRVYDMLRDKKIYWNAVRRGGNISPGWEDIKSRFNLKEIKNEK